MCGNKGFRIAVNLSQFFDDHKSLALLFVKEEYKTINDLQNRISSVFNVKNFHLICHNKYLPPDEDIRILDKDDIVWAVKEKAEYVNESQETKYHKGKFVASVLQKQEVPRKVKKKRKREIINETSYASTDYEEKSEYIGPIEKKRKKRKEKQTKEDANSEVSLSSKSRNREKIECRDSSYCSIENTEKIFVTENNDQVSVPLEVKKHQEKNCEKRASSKSTAKLKPSNSNLCQEVEAPAKKIFPKSEEMEKILSVERDRALQWHKRSKKMMDSFKDTIKSSLPIKPFTNSNVNGIKAEGSQSFINPPLGEEKLNKEYKCKGNLAQYTKQIPIPTITSEYLAKNKVNIVKIDVVSNKTTNDTEPVSKTIESSNEEANSQIVNGYVKNIVENIEKRISISSSCSSSDGLDEQKNVEKISSENKMEVDSTPPENIKVTSRNDEEPKENEEKKEKKTSDNFTTALSCDVSQNSYVMACNSFSSSKNDIEVSTYIEHNTPYNNLVNLTTNYDSTKHSLNVLATNSFTNHSAIVQNINDSIVDTPNGLAEEVSVDSETVQNTNDSTKDTSCGLATDTTIESEISAVREIDLPSTCSIGFKRKAISGTGKLIEALRKNTIMSVDSQEDTSEIKRKRKRTRKRKPRVDTPVANKPLSQVPRRIFTSANPSLHIKFDENGEVAEKLVSNSEEDAKIPNKHCDIVKEESVEDVSVVILSDEEENNLDFLFSEDAITKGVEMKNILPKEGDFIAFKTYKITEEYTPEISQYIIGKVHNFTEDRKVLFKILRGIDECTEPRGKFSIDPEDKDQNNKLHEFNWTELIEPKLLYP